MRSFYGLGFVLALGFATGLGGGCAASSVATSLGSGGNGAGSTTSSMGGTHFTGSGGSTGSGLGDAGLDAASCVTLTAQAQQAPAAMLVLLQASSSMTLSNKWPVSQQAVVQAIDEDVFDTMSLGLMAWPSTTPVTGPACIFNLPVYCGTPGLPQVPVQPAGMNKSTANMGVRHDMYQFLTNNNPVSEGDDPGNSTPLYDAMNNAYNYLQGVTGVQKRLLLVITDGGGSCTSLSVPQRPYYSDLNNCPDWEQPNNINTLISQWQTSTTTPIDTFIVGVPGSNSHGEMVGFYDTAPYAMRLALSTYAVSGSPSTVPSNCDKTAVFTQTGTDPAVPCHIDLSGGNFNAGTLGTDIATLRGNALGCVYPLPAPPMGQTIDLTRVNVIATVGGMPPVTVPKRTSPTDTCMTGYGCWDYDATMMNVDLLGVACSAVSTSAMAEVQIQLGCLTMTK